MDEEIVRSLRGDASPAERERVRLWRSLSPENEAHYQGILSVWQATAPSEDGEPPAMPDPLPIIRAAEMRREGTERPAAAWTRSLFTRVPRWGWALAAAIGGVAIGVRAFTRTPLADVPIAVFEPQPAPRTVTLEDGSLVRLSSGSSLEVLPRAGGRHVRLSGRAFFAVARDAANPFVVDASGSRTQVLGTRFEISRIGEASRAVVVEGSVSFANEVGSVDLEAGEAGFASAGRAPFSERPEDVYALLDWDGGVLLFQGTPLRQVVEEVSRRFGLGVTVVGTDMGELRITGSFEDETFEEVVMTLCEIAGSECSISTTYAVIGERD